MSAQTKLQTEELIFRKTNAQKGRTISITPENSTMKHLSYGRIILDQSVPKASFNTGNQESGLICLSGKCSITCDGVTNQIVQYDSIYLPRDSQVEVTTDSEVDLVECLADVENKYPLQVDTCFQRPPNTRRDRLRYQSLLQPGCRAADKSNRTGRSDW